MIPDLLLLNTVPIHLSTVIIWRRWILYL